MKVVKQGTLHKWTNYLYGWKKRYFVLHDNLLSYCKEKNQPLKGKISLQTLDIKKDPKKQSVLIINTGVNTMHLRASDPKEAQEWYLALKNAKESGSHPIPDPPITHSPTTLSQKVSELWKIFEMISAGLEKIPGVIRMNLAEVKDLVGLCACFKELASETLSLIETEVQPVSRRTYAHPSSDMCDVNSLASPKIFQGFEIEEQVKEDESVEFEDAHSHESQEAKEVIEDCPYRRCLPYLRNPNQKYNIWRVVKDSIGKDLSKMAVPVYFNEPISFLQRFTEDLTYHEIILNAAEQEDPCLRLAYAACFGVSSYVSTQQRSMKPFNPMLGETYEMVRDGYRVISEQVSHHPPVSAIHCEHEKFLFWGSVDVKTSFKGTYLNCVPTGTFNIMLKQFGDHFVWSKPQTKVHNIIFGKMYVDHYGQLEMTNISTGDKAVLDFHKKGWFEKVSTAVDGTIKDSNNNLRYKVFGNWNEKMSVLDLSTNKTTVVWEKYPYPEGYDHNYWFSDFAIQLNIPPELYPALPPTDSRYRPDQRALENGDLKLAVNEKLRVEEKQREARRVLESSGLEYQPKWFRSEGEGWVYAGGYWEARENPSFKQWPDIF